MNGSRKSSATICDNNASGSEIYGTGIDYLKLGRIEHLLSQYGESVPKLLLTPAEHATFLASRAPTRFLAMAFAAKEAFVKALGTGFAQGVGYRDAGIDVDAGGLPSLHFSDRMRERLDALRITHVSLSLSRTATHAVAVVVLECKSPVSATGATA